MPDDQDLLTFSEARARLLEEIEQERERLAALVESSSDEAAVDTSRRRIAALSDAAERNRAGASDGTFSASFGFSPRRNSETG